MNIAICEDHKEEAGWLKKQIEYWGREKGIPTAVTLYENADQFWFVSFFHYFPLFSRHCAIPASKYVSFSLVFALMGKLQGKVFLIQFFGS